MISHIIGQRRRVLLLIVLASFLLRVTLVLALRAYHLPTEQDHFLFAYEAGRIARSLAQGHGFASPFPMPSGATALLPPGYPLLLAGVFKVFGVYTEASAAAALILNCLFAALTSIPLFALGAAIFNPEAGLIAAALFAVYPPSIWHSVTTIWDTSLFTLSFAVSIWAIYRAVHSMMVKRWVLAGALTALTSLVNPAGLSVYAVAGIWALFRSRPMESRAIKGITAAALAAALILSPWILRNYILFGKPVLRSGLPLELKLGNDAVWNDTHPSFSKVEFARYVKLGEFPYMETCQSDAFRVIRHDPGNYAIAVGKRMFRFWSGIYTPDHLNYDQRPLWRRIATDILNLAPLSLALAGFAIAFRRGYSVGLFAVIFGAFPAVYYFTRVCERYRFPMDPYLIVLCSFALYCGADRLGRRRAAARDRNALVIGG
jgi:asparagine N-glycosylation enzyme membrane subunit Stt3